MTVTKQYGVKEGESDPQKVVGASVLLAGPLTILMFTLLLGVLILGNIEIWGAIF